MSDATKWIKQVAGVALGRFDTLVTALGIDGGKRQGNEYLTRNPTRADTSPGSFSINTRTGAWADFATGDKGGDLVALACLLWGERAQLAAADRLGALLGLSLPERASGTAKGAERPGKRRKAGAVGQSEATAAETRQRPGTAAPVAVPASAVCVMPVPPDAPPPPAAHARHGKPARRYGYCDSAGRLCFYHDRFEPKAAGTRKQFAPLTLWRMPDGAMVWQYKASPAPRPLLGLPELAARPEAVVIVTEGEKARAAAQGLAPDCVCVTWQGGAQAVDKADWRPLAGRQVWVWPDADAAGGQAAAAVCQQLGNVGAAGVSTFNLEALALSAHGEGGGAALAAGEPLAPGDDAADLVARGWRAEHLAQWLARPDALHPVSPAAGTPAEAAPAQPQAGSAPDSTAGSTSDGMGTRFELRDDGLYYIKAGYDRNDRYREDPPVKVCGWVKVEAMVRDRHGRGWCRLLALRDHDGRIRSLLLPDSALDGEGRDVTKPLRDAGLWVADNKTGLLKMHINQSRPTARARLTSRVGWHEDVERPGLWSFVFPDDDMAPIAQEGAERWLFDARGRGHALFKVRGTLEEWRDNVGALARGNSRLTVALCAGLAAGLTWVHPNVPGGLHWAGGSSLGKSALLFAVASLCGAPDYRRTWMQTGVAVEWLAAGHSDCPLLLDELKQAGDAREVAQAAYMLAAGVGKGRGQAAGGLRESAEFRALFQSNGEIGLEQFLRENNERSYAGQSVRFCELPGDARQGLGCWDNVGDLLSPADANNEDAKKTAGARFTDRVLDASARFYGTAYPAWLRYVTAHREALGREFNTMLPKFEARYLSAAAGGQARRVLVRFAAFALAGEHAIAAGILPLRTGEAAEAVGRLFREWVEAFGGESNQEPRRMVKQVRAWIQAHGPTRLGDMRHNYVEDYKHARPVNCAGWRRPTADTAAAERDDHVFEYLIYPAAFADELCAGFDYKQVAQVLATRGMLHTPPVGKDGRRRTQVLVREPGAGKPGRFYLLTPCLLEGEDDVY